MVRRSARASVRVPKLRLRRGERTLARPPLSWWAAFTVVAGCVVWSSAAAAQSPAAPAAADRGSVFAEIGGVAATRFVEDGNGVTTRAGPGPFLGAGASVALSRRISLVTALRMSGGALRVASSGRTWRAGTTYRADIRAGAEVVATSRIRLSGSAVIARVTGPDDVVPFRSPSGRLWTWGGEAAVFVAVPRHPRTALLVALDIGRIGSQTRSEPPLAGGWLGHGRIGVRHALR